MPAEPNTAPLATQGVLDAGFCQGTAGFAHSYNVAFQRTESVQMREQAKYWLAEILRIRQPGPESPDTSS